MPASSTFTILRSQCKRGEFSW